MNDNIKSYGSVQNNNKKTILSCIPYSCSYTTTSALITSQAQPKDKLLWRSRFPEST